MAQPAPVTHAGAIAVRLVDGAPRVLLVTAKRDPRRWIFPKGHVEPGESQADAALRELVEEGGWQGEQPEPVGTTRYRSRGTDVVVAYHLVRAVQEVGSDERRRRRWCDGREALHRLSFAELRELLEQVWGRVEERAARW